MAGMGEVSAVGVLEKISQGHLECPICFSRFTNPKILDCLHSFCQRCLEKMMEGHPQQREITCPVCRQQTTLSEAGIGGIANHFSLMALVDEVTQQEELVKSLKSKIICEVCEEEEAIVRCLECREYLCDFCHNAHRRSKKSKNHETTSIDNLRSGTAPYQSRLRHEVPKCPKHPSQDLYFFCETCTTLICAACTALDHKAPGHKFIDISAAVASCKEKVTELITEAKQCLNELTEAKEQALKSKLDHNNMTVKKYALIAKTADEAVAKIRDNERQLKEKLTKSFNEKESGFDQVLGHCEQNIQKVEKTLETVKTVMDQANNFDLVKLQPKLLRKLQDAADQETPAPVQGLTDEEVQQCKEISPAELEMLWKGNPNHTKMINNLPGPELAKMMTVGTRVVRGKDWKWENQDGNHPGVGTISDVQAGTAEGWVRVQWDTADSNLYRMGRNGKYDLQFAN